jgi:hypothetical protein
MYDPAPLEVSLVEKVKACRTCVWFWKGTPPYGPYPGFDWNTDFPPEALRNEKQPAGYVPAQPWLSANLVGAKFADPGIMHGCRKAPIMTIGINPNLTAWFPYTSSTPWIYPAFTAAQRYAYYYRHFTLYQESLALDFVHAHLDPGQRLLAEDDGYVIAASRESSHNYLQLAVRYRGSSEDKVYEITWKPDERWVVVQNGGYPDKPDSWFKKGDTLAGRFDAPSGASAEIYENAAGYYQRMVPVLDRFKKLTGLDAANLTIGEDVAQHDMVACASPGWQTKFDMPMDKIATNCVSDHGWMVAQFVQSQPAFVILVSTSALAMFRSVFAPFMTLQNADRDVYQLLDETCRRPTYVTIDIGAVKFRTRLIVSPHFSYPDGFTAGARLSENAWKAFGSDYPSDARLLVDKKRLTPDPKMPGPYLVNLQPEDDLRAQLSISGQAVLDAYFLDPLQMMAQALADEFKKGTITFDAKTGRLARASGPCRFCVNADWKFPEGCPYGKPDEPALPAGQLEDAVKAILAQGKHAAHQAAAAATAITAAAVAEATGTQP